MEQLISALWEAPPGGDGQLARLGLCVRAGFRGNRLSDTTCLTQVFFESGE